MLTTSAPGKLMLVGEWGVLELSCGCIVFPTPCSIKVTIIPVENDFYFDLTSIQLPILVATFSHKNLQWREVSSHVVEKAEFVRQASEVALRFLAAKSVVIRPFALATNNFDLPVFTKIGLGSSAAVVVATIKAILLLHQFPFTNELVYKLAATAHFYSQKKVGSGFDIAASVYAQPLYYRRFDPEWLKAQIEGKKDIIELVSMQWPNFICQKVHKNEETQILVGWSGYSAQTTTLVALFEEWKKKHPIDWQQISDQMKTIVDEVKIALEQKANNALLALIQRNHQLLLKLNEFIPIYTEQLRTLVTIAEQNYFAAKLSGAGGGDCGIAIGFDQTRGESIKNQWKQAGVEFLFEL